MKPRPRNYGTRVLTRPKAEHALRSLLWRCKDEVLERLTPESEQWRSIVRSNATPDAKADAMLAEIKAQRLGR